MLVLDLPHDLHGCPFVHAVSEPVLVAVGIAVSSVGEGVTVEFTGDGLATHISTDNALVVDESFHHWHHVGVLCADIDH